MRCFALALVLAVLLPQPSIGAPRDLPPRPATDAAPVSAHVQRVTPAVVGIRAQIPPDRPSALTLGPLRWGSGVIFDAAGYVLTVGYVVSDAASVEVFLRDKRSVPAEVVGADLEHGLAVLKLTGAGPWPAAALGDSASLAKGDATATLGVDDDNDLVVTHGAVQEIRAFAGYWEYLLDRAILVAPANPAFGGSALINTRGEVIGIVSLRLGSPPHVNLAIPIEVFTPVRTELIRMGQPQGRPPRPWIGIYTVPTEDGLTVAGGSPVGPAADAGFQRGDVIVRLNGEKIEGQEDFYRKLWRARPGEEISIVVMRDEKFEVVKVTPIDRYDARKLRLRGR